MGICNLIGSGEGEFEEGHLAWPHVEPFFLQFTANFQLRTSHSCGSDMIPHHGNKYTFLHMKSIL